MFSRCAAITTVALVLTACGSDASTGPNSPPLAVATSLQILDPGLVQHGDALRLRAEVRDQLNRAMPNVRVRWSTTHPEIVQVNDDGELFAMREGITELVAVYAGLTQRRALTIARRPAASFEVADANGRRLPVILEHTTDTLSDGRVEELIIRLEGGTVIVGGDYRVSLRIASYHRRHSNGSVEDRLVGLTTETDHGLVSFRTPGGDAAFYSNAVGNLMHWLTVTATGPVLAYRIGGTNTVLGLSLVPTR